MTDNQERGKVMENMVSRDGVYPVADTVPAKYGTPSQVKARWTGEFREPRQGEWFLSGAIVEAYRAKANMTTKRHIAKLVKARTLTVWEDAG